MGIPGILTLFNRLKKGFDAYAKSKAADEAMHGCEVGDTFTAPLPLDLEMRYRTRGGSRFRVRNIDFAADTFEGIRLPDKGQG